MDETMTPMTDRPLVTFALFAYNQEKYIREAVEGAFSQTYEPLEIILSDDCSSDRTFEIMQEMAAAYKGPHRVVVRRNTANLGTAMHVELAFRSSRGVLFVVAAGDDISKPQRVARLYETWQEAGKPPGIVHSARSVFKDCQNLFRDLPVMKNPYFGKEITGFAKGCWLPAAAPTCAFTPEIFLKFPPLIGGSIIEDMPLMFRGALLGKFIPCHEGLILQRLSADSSGSGYTYRSIARWNRFVLSKIIAFRNMQRDLVHYNHISDNSLRIDIEARLLRSMRSAAGLFVNELRPLTKLHKVNYFIKISLSPAVSGSLLNRMYFALSFLGFSFHMRLAARVKNYKSAIRDAF